MKSIAEYLKIKIFPFVIKNEKSEIIYKETELNVWVRYEYDDNGQITCREDSEFNVEKSTYCSRGLLKTKEGIVYGLEYSTLYEYDANANLISEKSDSGYWKRYDYDSNNNLIALLDSDDYSEIYIYNDKGLLMSFEKSNDGGVNKIWWEKRFYDEQDNLVKLKNSERFMEYWIFSDLNIIQEYGNTDNDLMQFDEKGRIKKDFNPDGKNIDYVYDDIENSVYIENNGFGEITHWRKVIFDDSGKKISSEKGFY